MTFLRRFFGGAGEESPDADEPFVERQPAVTAWVRLGDRGFQNEREQQRVFDLENRLIAALDETGAGMYETNVLEPGFFGMRMLGPDADRIVDTVRPLLSGLPPGSYLTLRRGPQGTSEERVEIEP